MLSEEREPNRAATVGERMPDIRLKYGRLEHRHGITLLFEHLLNGRRDMLRFPQKSCAAMACPSLSVRFVKPQPIQTAAGVCFEVVHDPLRWNLGLHHGMHVIASHMGCQQTPATLPAHLLNRFQYGIATVLIQVIGTLIHTFPLACDAR